MENLIASIKNTHLADTQSAIWYLGQEGFLIKSGETFLAFDPYLTDYVDRNCSSAAVNWKRLYPAPISPEAFDFVDYILLTHSHYDHADPETLAAVAKANPATRFIAPAPVKEVILSYGISPDRFIPAYADRPIVLGDITVTPIPSAHEEFHRDESGNYCELGYIVENPSGRFFHAGDMCMYKGLAERLTDIDVAFLPINGRDWFRNRDDIIGNFNCEEVARLAKETGMGLVVPMHYDLYEVNRVSAAVFSDTLARLNPTQKHHFFMPGERYIFMK